MSCKIALKRVRPSGQALKSSVAAEAIVVSQEVSLVR
jgi:hypothetical protein